MVEETSSLDQQVTMDNTDINKRDYTSIDKERNRTELGVTKAVINLGKIEETTTTVKTNPKAIVTTVVKLDISHQDATNQQREMSKNITHLDRQ